jgi:hypothetical protein
VKGAAFHRTLQIGRFRAGLRGGLGDGDDARREEPFDFGVVAANRAQNFDRGFANILDMAPHCGGCAIEMWGRAGLAQSPDRWVLPLDENLVVNDLGIRHHTSSIVDRARRHTLASEALHDFVSREFADLFHDRGADYRESLRVDAETDVVVAAVFEHVGAFEGAPHPADLIGRREVVDDLAIGGVGESIAIAGSTSWLRIIERSVVAHAVGPEPGKYRIEHCELDPLAAGSTLTSEEGGRHRLGRGIRRRLVRYERSDEVGERKFGAALSVDHAGDALNHRVETGPIGIRSARAKARDRDIDNVGIHSPDRRFVNAESFGHPRPEVLNENVDVVSQRHDEFAALRRLCIDGHTTFTPVVAGEQWREPAALSETQQFTVEGFDLDDLSALLGEHLGGERSRNNLAQVEDLHASHRAGSEVVHAAT